MAEKQYIEREAVNAVLTEECSPKVAAYLMDAVAAIPAADARPVPEGGIGEMSDGYHTFNGLYYQRMILFAALVKVYKDKAWKSWRHEDGELCFGGGWFIVGIDTPQGSYTYHYESKDWDMFDCEELPLAKHWDGHTEEDVTRLLSLDSLYELSAKVDSLQSFVDNITRLPDCNTCLKKCMCEFAPRPGQYCRINCPAWLGQPPKEVSDDN